jgi:hypothetical protein
MTAADDPLLVRVTETDLQISALIWIELSDNTPTAAAEAKLSVFLTPPPLSPGYMLIATETLAEAVKASVQSEKAWPGVMFQMSEVNAADAAIL